MWIQRDAVNRSERPQASLSIQAIRDQPIGLVQAILDELK